MSKWTNKEWLLGRTPEQLARKDAARQKYAATVARVDDKPKGSGLVRWGKTLTAALTLPIVGFVFLGVVGLVLGLVLGGGYLLLRRR